MLWLQKVMLHGSVQQEMHGMTAGAILYNIVLEPASHLPRVLNIKAALAYVSSRLSPEFLAQDFGDATGDDIAVAVPGATPAAVCDLAQKKGVIIIATVFHLLLPTTRRVLTTTIVRMTMTSSPQTFASFAGRSSPPNSSFGCRPPTAARAVFQSPK